MKEMLTGTLMFAAFVCLTACSSDREPHDATKPAKARHLTWDRQVDSLALRQDDQIVWRFNYGTSEGKPNFHPLSLPGGPVLSCHAPPDEPCHLGLWFSWKFINQIDYWEGSGRTVWQPPVIETRHDFSARVVLDLEYHPTNGPAVLAEHRIIDISPPDSTGQYRLDWRMTFRSVGGNTLLDRSPPVDSQGRNIAGGYGGLSFRATEELTGAQAVTLEGPAVLDNHRFRGKSAALDFSGLIGDRAGGIAFLDEPGNLNSPTPWYVVSNPPMYYAGPAVLTFAPKLLSPGETLELRYRVVVHPETWTADELQKAWRSYQSTHQKRVARMSE